MRLAVRQIRMLKHLLEDDTALAAVEYGLILGFLSLTVLAGLVYLSAQTSDLWLMISRSLDAVM